MVSIKNILICGVMFVAFLINSGCSFANLENRIGRDDGMTYERIETMQPKTRKVITIRKINGRYIVVDKENIHE